MNLLNRLYNGLLYPIRTNRGFYMYLLALSVILTVVSNIHQSNDIFLATLIPIWGAYLYCLLATALRPLYLRWIAWLVASLMWLGEIFSVLFYQSLYSVRLVKLILETDTREASEFLSGLWATPALWITLACGVAAALMAYALVRAWTFVPKLARRILIALMLILTLWSALRGEHSYIKLIRCFRLDSVAQLNDERYLPCLRTPTIRFVYGIAYTTLSVREYETLVPAVEQTRVDDCSFRSPCIVLIIGESFNKHHTPLYNPTSLPTTPNLCRLRDNGSLAVFTDVVTPSNLTAQVFKELLSTPNTLFPAVFRKAGYDVFFWSNQFVVNGTGGLFSNLGGALVNHPDLARLQFTARNTSTFSYDSDLNADLRAFIADSLHGAINRPSLFIVHYIGQHVSYADRFPPEYNCFSADSLQPTYGGKQGCRIRAEYANATLFHDHCLAELWQLFADRDAIAVYLSDHGEEVYDWRNFYERSDQNSLNPQIAHYQFEIPFFVLTSDSFRLNHPDIMAEVAQAVHKPFINSDVCHLLFHLAGIRMPDYRPDRDILSLSYDTMRHRFIGDHTDYDELIHDLN